MSDHKGLSESEREALKAAITAEGSSLEKVAEESGASEFCLAKAAAGFPCQKGTIALVRNYVNSKT